VRGESRAASGRTRIKVPPGLATGSRIRCLGHQRALRGRPRHAVCLYAKLDVRRIGPSIMTLAAAHGAFCVAPLRALVVQRGRLAGAEARGKTTNTLLGAHGLRDSDLDWEVSASWRQALATLSKASWSRLMPPKLARVLIGMVPMTLISSSSRTAAG